MQTECRAKGAPYGAGVEKMRGREGLVSYKKRVGPRRIGVERSAVRKQYGQRELGVEKGVGRRELGVERSVIQSESGVKASVVRRRKRASRSEEREYRAGQGNFVLR